MDSVASHPEGVVILLVTSCYGNRDKLRLCGPFGSCADFHFSDKCQKSIYYEFLIVSVKVLRLDLRAH